MLAAYLASKSTAINANKVGSGYRISGGVTLGSITREPIPRRDVRRNAA
jgi:hypothetical protein